MDIIKILKEYHTATEVEKRNIENQVRITFRSMPDKERKEVQKIFLKSLDDKIDQAEALIEEANLKMELAYVS